MKRLRIIATPAKIQNAGLARPLGLVPTMGALHEGHLALIRQSAGENRTTVVSLFVNPSQFTNPADLARYPRNREIDAELAASAGADVLFAPEVETVYPPGFSTTVEVSGVTTRWEGEFRPGHFHGVATVVTVLLNTIRPDRAYFGEKDYQQIRVIERMSRDLRLPGEIVRVPTVRDHDGLALSSRNFRLSDDARKRASAIPAALFRMAEVAASGEADVQGTLAAGCAILASVPELTIDYLAIVDPVSLEPLVRLIPGARAMLAVNHGGVRLIDNIELMSVDDLQRIDLA